MGYEAGWGKKLQDVKGEEQLLPRSHRAKACELRDQEHGARDGMPWINQREWLEIEGSHI